MDTPQLYTHSFRLKDESGKPIEGPPTEFEPGHFLKIWQAHMETLHEVIIEGIEDLQIIDKEKVNAYLGTDGAMVVDDNTLILPPE